MSSKPRVIIITGNSKRHDYYVECVERELDVIQVYAETKFNYVDAFAKSAFADAVANHFSLRDKSEQSYFGNAAPKSPIKTLPRGGANKPEVVEEIIALQADFVLLFGSGIIKKPILEAYQNRVINLHLGLSPYYRGSGTNFWPLVDGKPECVGATLHLAVLKVDAGGILHQVRPQGLTDADSIHDLGNKTIMASVAALPQIVRAYHNGIIHAVKQEELDEQEFKRKDLSAESLTTMNSNFDQGMIKAYLDNQDARKVAFPIVEQL